MYHYIKWTVILLFVKRNIKNLFFIMLVLGLILLIDAVYDDYVDFLHKAGKSDDILYYFVLKWIVTFLLLVVLFWLIKNFFNLKNVETKADEKERLEQSDPYMKRLEKFKRIKKLKSKSDLLIEKHKSKK